MLDVTTKLRLQSLKDWMGTVDAANVEVYNGLKAAVSRGILRIETKAKQDVPVFTGRLRNSIQQYQTGLSGFVAAHTYYAWEVEHGLGPGTWPPYRFIEYWFMRKSKIPYSKRAQYYPVIMAIRKKIHDVGKEPHPYMGPAFESVLDSFINECKEAAHGAWN